MELLASQAAPITCGLLDKDDMTFDNDEGARVPSEAADITTGLVDMFRSIVI
jgi:hypothetical protein